jgi:putative transposase
VDRTFFITSVTAQRKTLFQRDAVSDLLVDVFQHYRDQGKYLLHDFVIMPDHFHALITPANEISMEKAISVHQGRILVSSEIEAAGLATEFHESSNQRQRRLRAASRIHPDESCARRPGSESGGLSVFVGEQKIRARPGAAGAEARA